ncbi:histidine phosphatase family protein [Paenibacillus hemerocallicola]|jgi:2,3-bisphosphoglycerate-dependent phosphoglycerate mutase|uniref:Histidine phosphatase family protein n=1 Tax=Paenibacillus hemerocallicola TaxID=1172614 RepID=A0A5C4THI3_9BACL|nr:histidine phosphatase family protein [Paenibacillus hemerocallicola]TNJ68126.1 histidine phosphatase family protein [Paenibacillus hemerocallicola]
MNTIIYFIRHAESVFVEGAERERGLTEKGKRDTTIIRDILKDEQIDEFVSSPYKRAVDTIQLLADTANRPIRIEEDLRERQLSAVDLGKDRFFEAKRRAFEEPDYVFPGGESSNEAQHRAIAVISRLLQRHNGKKIAIGTHGDIMTLMLKHYDKTYGFDFWKSTTMPDIYRLEFDPSNRLTGVTRRWK